MLPQSRRRRKEAWEVPGSGMKIQASLTEVPESVKEKYNSATNEIKCGREKPKSVMEKLKSAPDGINFPVQVPESEKEKTDSVTQVLRSVKKVQTSPADDVEKRRFFF